MLLMTFFSDIAPSWLTAIGTIGAVFAAVGQTIWSDKKKAREDKHRSANARIFIDSLLTDYKSKFTRYSDLKYVINDKNVIEEGNLQDLYTLLYRYKRTHILEICTDYTHDLKFGIQNIGIQTDNHTIEALSERFKSINSIKTSIDAVHDIKRDGSKKYETEEFVLLIREEMIKIDAAIQILKEDLTDKDEK